MPNESPELNPITHAVQLLNTKLNVDSKKMDGEGCKYLAEHLK